MKKHSIKSGECLASLAKHYGFHDCKVIYDAPVNEVLRLQRPNMHVLQEGDQLFIPERQTKSVRLGSGIQHTFKVKGQVTEFVTLVQDSGGNALANMPYELDVGGYKLTGITDKDGLVRKKIDASAKTGKLIIFLDELKKNVLTWPLEFGSLPPHDSAIGIQARLNNLGYFCANETGVLDDTTKDAISAFKSKHGLTANATVDERFLAALKHEYGF
ncbi:peptidoglycan-binding protein [Ningiella sp. W23]|uniref:peptidoglycan-binding domain-containing protein n=1 Tax=Ningiella sp. W23 TaxID=3023715 RepID=UPI0037581961